MDIVLLIVASSDAIFQNVLASEEGANYSDGSTYKLSSISRLGHSKAEANSYCVSFYSAGKQSGPTACFVVDQQRIADIEIGFWIS
jgi:hypothetical protein